MAPVFYNFFLSYTEAITIILIWFYTDFFFEKIRYTIYDDFDKSVSFCQNRYHIQLLFGQMSYVRYGET